MPWLDLVAKDDFNVGGDAMFRDVVIEAHELFLGELLSVRMGIEWFCLINSLDRHNPGIARECELLRKSSVCTPLLSVQDNLCVVPSFRLRPCQDRRRGACGLDICG